MILLPETFCWTRFGTEAGQTVESILARKEQERDANDGVFYWGIGNAIGPSLRRLLEMVASPLILFSPIHSAPRREDVKPSSVVAWTEAEGFDGSRYSLPNSCLVTSALRPTAPRAAHYALVCQSEISLMEMGSLGVLDFGALRNLVTGSHLGSSQTTAVVRRQCNAGASGREYRIAMRAQLVHPYLVRLSTPIPLGDIDSTVDWQAVVAARWAQKRSEVGQNR